MKKLLSYYVYAYLREDGTPYYIGKGINYRVIDKRHYVPIPKNNGLASYIRVLIEPNVA